MTNLTERFFKYISIDTQADDSVLTCPSNENEMLLAELLREEFEAMGFGETTVLDDKGFLYARIPANIRREVPSVAFFSHLDTYPELPGSFVKPRIIPRYSGEDIVINTSKDLILSPREFPELNLYFGDDLIVSDGNTLLGSDGKAGVAEMMQAAQYLHEHPELPHGDIYMVFTPDEELGYSVEHIDIGRVKASYGFTLDTGAIGELSYENFNAAVATVTVNGLSIHPGRARHLMQNAILLANEFLSLLPSSDTPGETEGYEGYYHVTDIVGSVEKCKLTLTIRDFDAETFQWRKNRLQEIADFLNAQYGKNTFRVLVEDYYRNMKEMVDTCPEIVDIARKAIVRAGLTPTVRPIRGGTDGVSISFMGIPCPNIFSGSHNTQSLREFISVRAMEKSVEVILNIIGLFAAE